MEGDARKLNLGWVKPFLLKTRQGIVRNAPHILMGLGTAESIAAVIFTAKAAPAAKEACRLARIGKAAEKNPDIDEYTLERFIESGDLKGCDLTIWETIKVCARYFGPAVAMELLSLLCFWSAHGINLHRQAVLAGLYSTAEETIRGYQRKVQELIGEKAEKEVRNAQAQDLVDKNPPPSQTYILDGDTERDYIFKGQYFRSTYTKIKDAQNDANHEMIQHMYISEAEVMWLLDPDRKYLKPDNNSGQVGWTVDNLMVFDIRWATAPNHQPVGVVEILDKDGLEYPPTPGFSRLM